MKATLKTLLYICIILFVFTSCSKKIQPFEFENKIAYDAAGKEKREFLQKTLNKMGKPLKGVSITGYNCYYTNDGKLYIEGFIRNNTGYNIKNIKGEIIVIKNKIEVAKGYFEFEYKELGVLKDKYSRPWTIIFNTNEVKVKNENLDNYMINAVFVYDKTGEIT
jgi:SLAP domain-containing protein